MLTSHPAAGKISLRYSAGQSLVELALMLPLLLLILLGVVDLGRLFYAYTTLTNAAREGARYGSTNPTDTAGIRSRVKNEAANVLNLQNINIPIQQCAPYADNPPYSYSTGYCSSAQTGDRIQVTVDYTFQFITLYLFGIQNLGLSNTTAMAIIKTN